MNVLFHTTTAIGVAVLLTDTKKIEQSKTIKEVCITSITVFIASVFSHGILDYMPHCYPINSKIDAILSLFLILVLTFWSNKKYRMIVGLSFFGSVFPDLIDLSPSIINKLLRVNLPIIDKVFPWHWHQYSGSIYNGECVVSMLNHSLLIMSVFIICWCRWHNFKKIFNVL